MRISTPVEEKRGATEWCQFLSIGVFFPLLGLYALYLSLDYLSLLHLTQVPDFWTQNILKANFVCWGPGLMAMSWVASKNVYFPQATPLRHETHILAFTYWLTLGLLLAVNTLIIFSHFTIFSPDRYVHCWEPFPMAVWHYAKTADICVQHGLAPVQNLGVKVL